MKKYRFLVLFLLLYGGEAFSQNNLGFRWVRELPQGAFPFQWGGYNGLTSVSKRGNTICFTDAYMFDPLEVRPNGLTLPMDEYAFGLTAPLCGLSSSSFALGLQFSPKGESVRQYTITPPMGEYPDHSGLMVYHGSYNFSFTALNERQFPVQYLPGKPNQYDFGFGLQRKVGCNNWQWCNQHLPTLFLNVYNADWGPQKTYFQQPYPFELKEPKLNRSREGLPLVSFQSLDSVEWKGAKWRTNGPANVQLVLNDSLDIIRQYQFPVVEDSNFVAQWYQGSEGLSFQIGNRLQMGEMRAKIQRLDSLGQVKWTYLSALPEMLTGFKMDPAGNCLFFTKNLENQLWSYVVVSLSGNELWRYTDTTETFKQISMSVIDAVDTLEWAFSGYRDWNSSTNDFQFGSIQLHLEDQYFIGLVGRQAPPLPLLSIDQQSSGCQSTQTRIVVENQGVNFGSANQFQVELSDSSGHFGPNPTILSSGTNVFINLTIPANIPPGPHYQIRIRATDPDTVGPPRAFPIYPAPQKPLLTLQGDEIQVCASQPYIKPLNPQAGVQYRWNNQTWGDSLQVQNFDYVQVEAILGTCIVKSDYAFARVINPDINLLSSQTICADSPPVTLLASIPVGYWTGPQVDSSGLFSPQPLMDTLEVVYHTEVGNCKVDQPFTLYQITRPILQPVADSTFCGSIQWTLPMEGFLSEYWTGPKVNNGVFANGNQFGTFTLIHTAGPWECSSRDTVIITARSQDHPYCKAGLDSLANLQTMLELTGNICNTNRGYKIWAHWEHYENDAERPYRLEFSTLANDFSNPVFQNQQLIPYFSGNLNLGAGTYFYRVVKLNPLEAGPVDTIQLFALPEKPIIVKTGPSSYCPGAPINQTKYYVAQNPAVTHLWMPGNVIGDTLIPNSIGSFTVRAVHAVGCTSAISNAQTIVYKSLGTFSMTSPAKVCLPAAPFPLQSNVTSPTWMGTQVDSTTGIFYPATLAGNAVVQARKVINGCLVIKSFDIAQWNKPPIGPNYSFQTCPELGPITLEGKPAGGTWSGNGVVGQSLFFSSVSGTFPLVYTTQNSQCQNADTIFVQVSGGNPLNCFTGTTNIEESTGFKIQPNPGRESFSLTLPGIGFGNLIIFNSLGQRVFEKEWHTTAKTESLILPDHFPSGVYSLVFDQNGRQHVEKLVIE